MAAQFSSGGAERMVCVICFIPYHYFSVVALGFSSREKMIFGFAIIFLLFLSGNALSCLQCDGVSHPRHCRYVADCFDNEKCLNATSRGSNTGSCHECCDSNLCNAAGCGEIGYPPLRGPVGYHCPVQVDVNSCGTVEFCEQGETCTSTGVSSASIVGRDLKDARDQPSIYVRTIKDVVCGGCCDGDLCNKGCNGTHTIAPSPCDAQPCEHGTCFNQNNGYVCVCDSGYEGKNCNMFFPTDCYDILNMNLGNTSGVYGIHLWRTHQYLEVFCEMDIDGGGWTVFQHRFDGSENFNQSFDSYTKGFGNASGEYWLGKY
ncbi:neurogenic locus notch homolog protein 3-like [Mercenaria mercenaria]|uniref:neurogenic locus notch homolog protein 3-like n=1 Tax=Mercenaria mercenaria TaxID=6596 RepID=UPI00234F10E3|nr:neurogenic locus notch homolog protein 3-like [Mercenaria mercenaria]